MRCADHYDSDLTKVISVWITEGHGDEQLRAMRELGLTDRCEIVGG
jgi:hypothetical protein